MIQTDENGKPLTYWGGLKDRTCNNSCSVVCGECQLTISSQTEISDKDIFDQATLAMEERYGSGCEEEIENIKADTPEEAIYYFGAIYPKLNFFKIIIKEI